MKISKKMLAIILALILIVSTVTVAAVNVSAAAGDKIYCRASFTPNCYMWKKNTQECNKAWPGVAMTKVSGETDIYCYTVPDNKFDMIIFNGNGQTGDLSYPGGNKLYDYSAEKWSDYSPDPLPVISVSKDGGSFKDSIDVTITVDDANSAYYTIDGGSRFNFSGSTTVTLGAGIAEGASVKLDITAVNSFGTANKSCTFKKRSSGGAETDGSTSPALTGNYATNPNNGFGARKTITVDGDKSDWNSSMLIAQGVANDDPRVYAKWSMHEVAIDDYAMYAAWDDTNLYIMYEMANVQDAVASGENFPLTQGNLWIYNLPVFVYIYTGNNNITHNETAGGTLWDSGTTIDANSDYVIAYSTNASNGPFIYTANDDGKLEPDVLVKKGADTGIKVKWGNGKTLSGKLMGINSAGSSKRTAGDSVNASLTDFYSGGHNAKLDMFYEVSIPLKNLDLSAADIEANGIGIMKVSTFGTSGMDCLPYDLSMADNAVKPYSKDSSTSAEKEDQDHITVPMARIGKAFTGGAVNPTQPTEPPVTYRNVSANVTSGSGTATANPTRVASGDTATLSASPAGGWRFTGWRIDGAYSLSSGTLSDSTVVIKPGSDIQAHASFEMIPTEPPTDPPVPYGEKTIGDLDNDGEVNIVDVTIIQRYLLGMCNIDGTMPYNPYALPDMDIADVDGDDDITIVDATVIQRYLLGIITDLASYRYR